MKLKRVLTFTLAAMMAMGGVTGCGNSSTQANSEQDAVSTDAAAEDAASGEELSGEITFITHRTDLKDRIENKYIKEFTEKHPNVTVKYEALKNYENDIQVRMNTAEYGDVLMIPNINKNEYSNFFVPLGTLDELSQKYRNVSERAFDGQVYGIPSMINATGVLYNKKVFENAGVTEIPKTPDDFLAAMQKIKDKGEAIPYYTNYKDQWPLTQWEGCRLAYGNPNYLNELAKSDDPFAPGKVHYDVYKVLYDLVKQGLVEEDPMTTDWESSKQMIADGEIGAMVLGNWAVSQVKAKAANPDDICFMPFPLTAPDGKQYAEVSADLAYAVNVNSPNQDAALAFLWYMVEDSGYAEEEFGLSPQVDGEYPESLMSFKEAGVEFISAEPAPAGEEDLYNTIDLESEVGTWQPEWKLIMVEAALGNRSESYDDICNEINEAWNTTRAELAAE